MDFICICGKRYEQAGRLERHEKECRIKKDHLAKEDIRRRARKDDDQRLKHKASQPPLSTVHSHEPKTTAHGLPFFRRSRAQDRSEGTSGAVASAHPATVPNADEIMVDTDNLMDVDISVRPPFLRTS